MTAIFSINAPGLSASPSLIDGRSSLEKLKETGLLRGHWTSAKRHLTMADATQIQAFKDRSGNGLDLNRYSTSTMAHLETDPVLKAQYQLAGYDAAVFQGTTLDNGDYYSASNTGENAYVENAPFTHVIVMKMLEGVPADNDYAFGRFQGTTARSMLRNPVGVNEFQLLIGGQSVSVEYEPNGVIIAKCGFGATNGSNYGHLNVNGVGASVEMTSGTTSANALSLGAFSVAVSQAADMLFWDAMTFHGAGSNFIGDESEHLDTIDEYLAVYKQAA